MPTFSFDKPAPLKTKETDIPEWSDEGKFIITELRGSDYQNVIDLFAEVDEADMSKRAMEAYSTLLSLCLTWIDGSKPTSEWLLNAAGAVLKRVGDEALQFNGFSGAAKEALEKN